MTTTNLRVLAMVGGAAVGITCLLFLLLANDQAAGGVESQGAANDGAEPGVHVGERPASPGVKARPVDPANYIAAEQTTDPDRRGAFTLEADRSKDLVAAVRAGETHWQPTLIDMDFSKAANDTYLECSAKYLRQPCPYDIDYVIEVKEPGIGEIVFGRVVMEKVYSKDCEEYVKCVVKGNVGASVVVSPEVDGSFSRRKSQIDNYPEVTIEELEEMLEIMQTGIAMMEERGPDGQLDWEYRLALERSYIYLIKMRIASMR